MEETSLLTFPCDFPIKVIGENSETFLEEIRALVLEHFPDFPSTGLTSKPSKQGNYLALSLIVPAKDKPSLDAFYQAVSKHPTVKMVL